MPRLNGTTQKLRFKLGTAAQITAAENAYGEQGEAVYITDRKQLYVHNGTEYESVNKYYVKTVSEASNAAPTFNTDEVDELVLYALAANTNLGTNKSGTPYDGQRFVYRIKDNGTTRNITWPSDHASLYATLPASTTAGKWHEIEVRYYAADSKFYCISALVQP